MGKYSNLKGELTTFSEEPEYQEKVLAERERIKEVLMGSGEACNLNNLGGVYITAKLEKKRLEDLIKSQNLTLAAMTQEIVELLEGEGFSSLKLGNGVSMSIKDDVYCTVKDKEAFYAWIRANKLEDLFSVNYQTMSSMVKNKLVDGEEIPPGIEPYFKQGIMVRGVKNLDQD